MERPLVTKPSASTVPAKPEKAAPIAQAECSDTDWESARTNVRGNSIEKNGSGSYEGSGGTLRGMILINTKNRVFRKSAVGRFAYFKTFFFNVEKFADVPCEGTAPVDGASPDLLGY